MDKPLPERYRFSLSLYEDGRAQVLLWDMAARLLAPGISTLGTSQFQYFSSTPSHPMAIHLFFRFMVPAMLDIRYTMYSEVSQ